MSWKALLDSVGHVLQWGWSISCLTCSIPCVMQILSLVPRRSGHHDRLFRTCTRKCWLRTWSTPWTRKSSKICKNTNDNRLHNDSMNLHESCLVWFLWFNIWLTFILSPIYLRFSWNHAFKNQITTLQSQAKNRANPNRSEVQANLSLFLEAASGFYTQVSGVIVLFSIRLSKVWI